MIIKFEDEDLEIFIETGKSEKKFYRKLSSNKTFMNDLSKVMLRLRAAINVVELSKMQALNYEKLKHDLQGKSSIRIGYTSKYRMIFTEHDNGIRIIVIEINEHYGDK